jgi:hypothetical protein
MGPEAKVKAAIRAFLKTLKDCWWYMPAAHGYGINGVPDFVGCYRGVFFAIEAKAPGKLRTLTPLQQAAIRGINDAQGWAVAADDVETVELLFENIDIMLEEKAA